MRGCNDTAPPTPLAHSFLCLMVSDVTLHVLSLGAPPPIPPHASDWLRSFAASQLDVTAHWLRAAAEKNGS